MSSTYKKLARMKVDLPLNFAFSGKQRREITMK